MKKITGGAMMKLAMTAVLWGALIFTAQAQWEKAVLTEQYLPDLRCVHFANNTTGCAAGDGGADLSKGIIYISHNAGTSWTKAYTGNDQSFSSIWMASATNIFAGGYDDAGALMMHSTDAGKSWKSVSLPLVGSNFGEISSIRFLDANNGFAAGYGLNTFALKTTDGGKSWKKCGNVKDEHFALVYFMDNMNGYVSGYDDDFNTMLYATNDGGASWQKKNSMIEGFTTAISFKNESEGYLSTIVLDRNFNTAANYIYSTTDKGLNWSRTDSIKTSGDDYVITDLQFFSTDTAYMLQHVDDTTHLRMSVDGGATWLEMTTGLEGLESYNHIYFADASHGFAVGNEGIYGTLVPDEIPTGIAMKADIQELNIFPNPLAGRQLNISLPEALHGAATLSLMDMSGRLVWMENTQALQQGTHSIDLPAEDIENGLYFFRISTADAEYGSRLNVIR